MVNFINNAKNKIDILNGLYFRDMPTTLENFLRDYDSLTVSDHSIPVATMNLYCSGRSNQTSLQTVTEIGSSTAKTSAGGTKPLNQFRLMSMSDDRPGLVLLPFDENSLYDLVRSKCPDPKDRFDTFLSDLTTNLTKIRNIIYSIKVVDGVSKTFSWREDKVQCMMSLFLNYMFTEWDRENNLLATAANGCMISLSVNSGSLTYRGSTDLMCHLPRSPSVFSAAAIVEMKVPFGTGPSVLFHSKAISPKQQVLGQAMALLASQVPLSEEEEGAPRTRCLCYLTDMVALSVLYYVPGKGYLSERVTDAKAFCLRLLLMCCDLSKEEWSRLLPAGPNEEAVDVSEEGDVDIGQVDAASSSSSDAQIGNTSAAPAYNTRGAGSRDANYHQRGTYPTFCGEIGSAEEDAHELRLADICNMRRWEAKCRGVRYLGSEELQML